jgi:hypothetical protein
LWFCFLLKNDCGNICASWHRSLTLLWSLLCRHIE